MSHLGKVYVALEKVGSLGIYIKDRHEVYVALEKVGSLGIYIKDRHFLKILFLLLLFSSKSPAYKIISFIFNILFSLNQSHLIPYNYLQFFVDEN